MSNRLMPWFRVPDGSTLEVTVSGSDENFNSTATLIVQPGPVETIPHEELAAGFSKVLDSPLSYSLVINTSFLGADETTVTIEGSVTKPDGGPYGAPRPPHLHAAQNGTQDTMVVLAVTQGEGG